jgi:anti-sigma-K factor RskA
MASANCPINTELISDYAAGRLDVEDVRVIEDAIDRDRAVAAAVAAARRVNSRMIISLARRVEAEIAITRRDARNYGRARGPVSCIYVGVR